MIQNFIIGFVIVLISIILHMLLEKLETKREGTASATSTQKGRGVVEWIIIIMIAALGTLFVKKFF